MDYNSLKRKLKQLGSRYKISVIGKTNFNRKIFAVEVPCGKIASTAILVAAMHGREHITADLAVKMLEDGLFDGLNFNVIVLPMANPDGVELSANGLRSAPRRARAMLTKINGGSPDFKMWKANGLGVDINNNFDARFFTNVSSNVPAPQGYPGEHAESTPEAKAIADFVRKTGPFVTVSYHSKGEEIYYNFFQQGKRLERDSVIAERFASSTGYQIKNPELSSSGGFKDWCVSELGIPALTIEVGSDALTHPIGLEELPEIFYANKNIAKDLEFAYNVFREYKDD